MGVKMGEAVVPFIVMVGMEGSTVGLTILAKTAITNGRGPFLFVLYSNVLASLILLCYSFFYPRDDRPKLPLFTFSLLLRLFLMGLTGICLSQNFAFVGLSYSSPIVVCAMGLLIPAFSFLLSIILRTKKIDCASSSSIVKVMGTVISITGAVTVGLCRGGPIVRNVSSSSQQLNLHKLLIFTSSTEHWLLGCILLAAASFSISLWNLFQVRIATQNPHVMKVASFYSSIGTILCAFVCLLVERNPTAWKLNFNLELLLIVVTPHSYMVYAEQGAFLCNYFKPFGIIFVGVTFFGDTFQYGRCKKIEIYEDQSEKILNFSDEKVRLLQEGVEV